MHMNFAGYRVLPEQFVVQHSNGALDPLRTINLTIIRIRSGRGLEALMQAWFLHQQVGDSQTFHDYCSQGETHHRQYHA